MNGVLVISASEWCVLKRGDDNIVSRCQGDDNMVRRCQNDDNMVRRSQGAWCAGWTGVSG